MLKSKLHLLPLPGKVRLLLAIFGLFLLENREESEVKELNHTIPGQLPVKKTVIATFSGFAATDHKGYFGKILTQIFKFGCFSFVWYHI